MNAEEINSELAEMLDLQLGFRHQCRADGIPNDEFLYITLNNIIGEANESAAYYGSITKPWKKNLELPLEEVQEELVDILHFLLQAFIILDMDADDIVELYRIKNRINHRRVKAKREEAEGVWAVWVLPCCVWKSEAVAFWQWIWCWAL